MWIARDKDGELWLYFVKPHKSGVHWKINPSVNAIKCAIRITKDKNVLPEVKWEDEEPKEIILK